MPARIARQSESYHVPTEEPAPLPPPEKIASALRGVGIPSGTHRRAAFGQDDMTDEEMWREYERQREDAIHQHTTEPHPSGVNVHTFRSTGEGYDKSQYLDSIKHGDIFVVPDEGVVGFLHEAWPIAVTQQHGAFHALEPDAWSDPEFAHAQNAVEHARKLGYPLDPNIPQSPDSGGTDR